MSETPKDLIRRTYAPQELAAMSRDDLAQLFLRAVKIEATCVVRRADGSIKYDDPSLAGTYHEENLK